jgi:predicted transcriptional regulator
VFRAIVWKSRIVSAVLLKSLAAQGICSHGYLFSWVYGRCSAEISRRAVDRVHWVVPSNAATASVQQMTLERLLAGHTVGEIMTRECTTLAPEVTLEQLVHDHILKTGRRCFPVARAGRVEGLLTLHHVKEIPRERWAATTAEQAMTPLARLRIARSSDGLGVAMQEMTQEGVNQLPVIDAVTGDLVGVLARDNVLTFVRTLAQIGV